MQRPISFVCLVTLCLSLATTVHAAMMRPAEMLQGILTSTFMTQPGYECDLAGDLRGPNQDFPDFPWRLDIQDNRAYLRSCVPYDAYFGYADVSSFLTHPANPVPEPGTMVLLGVGLMGASFVFRKQARR